MPEFKFQPRTQGKQDGFIGVIAEPTHEIVGEYLGVSYKILTFDPHEKVAFEFTHPKKGRKNIAILGDGICQKNQGLLEHLAKGYCAFLNA